MVKQKKSGGGPLDNFTTIGVTWRTKRLITLCKIVPGETYNEVIQRVFSKYAEEMGVKDSPEVEIVFASGYGSRRARDEE